MEKKKKNFFRQHLSFTIFLCLAIGVVLVAILAPVITGGVSPYLYFVSVSPRAGSNVPSLLKRV